MIGVYVKVPIACFRVGHAREYWESLLLPPPSTCYGFLLSFVGENGDQGDSSGPCTDARLRHLGVRVSPTLMNQPDAGRVLRTLWRIKSKSNPPGVGDNKTPGYQQLLTNVELIIWLDSGQEMNGVPDLETRVTDALDPSRRGQLHRFGGLSLGESTHLVDEVYRFSGDESRQGQAFLLNPTGRYTFPVWVDHVGSAGTKYVTGDLVPGPLLPPDVDRMPRIERKMSAT